MITLEQYWMGRDKAYTAELTHAIRDNAVTLLDRINLLLSWANADGVRPGIDMHTMTEVSSGWRPKAVNDKTANASAGSKHKTGCGIDIRDTPDRQLARWCLRNQDALVEIGLWMEDPRWTPTWVHLQSVAPNSGRIVYVPSNAPPLMAALPEQRGSAVV